MDSHGTPEIWVCSICRTGVSHMVVKSGDTITEERWVHSRGSHDHQPNPIRREDLPGQEIATVCDLCSSPYPQNLWRTSSTGGFIADQVKGIKLTLVDRDNAWLICDECEPLVERGDLRPVLERVYESLKALNPDMKFDTTTRALMADRVGSFLNSRVGHSERRTF